MIYTPKGNFDFDKAVEKALLTWYPKGHELHLNPHHPLGKLLGEWGKLLDDYMKLLYKPRYKFDPIDELGDIWYYIRILTHQKRYKPTNHEIFDNRVIDYVIATAIDNISTPFRRLVLSKDNTYPLTYTIDMSYSALLEICNRHNITLQQLTDSNWEKLKPGSERGEQWMKAR